MRIIILLFLSVLTLNSCQKELQSSEEFVDQYLNYVKKKDNDALYNQCYVSSKSEIRKLMQELSRSNKIDEKRLDDMYEAAREDINRLYSKTRISITPESNIQIDSIIDSPQKLKGFGGDLEPGKGVRINNISAFIKVDTVRYRLLFPCIDLNTGKWKLVKYPDVELLD